MVKCSVYLPYVKYQDKIKIVDKMSKKSDRNSEKEPGGK